MLCQAYAKAAPGLGSPLSSATPPREIRNAHVLKRGHEVGHLLSGCRGNDNQGYVASCSVKAGSTVKIEALGSQLPLPVHLWQLPSAATQVITFVY